MGGRRQQSYNARAFVVSVGWILALLACYWLISDWQVVPRLFTTALDRIH